jgi:hypothetical protein
MSCTRAEEILETPNSAMWPGCNSTATKSLKVSSDDGSTNGVLQRMKKKTAWLRTVGGGARSA